MLDLSKKVYRISFTFCYDHVICLILIIVIEVSTKIKETSEKAYFFTKFALTKIHKYLRDRKSEVWSPDTTTCPQQTP